MSDGTKIEWTDATLNVVNGCTVTSPGCANCYAMRAGARNLPGHPSTGLTQPSKAGHVWTGEVRFNEAALMQPLRWRRPRRIFWNAHGDLFHESVPDAWIDKVLAVCALTPQHSHQILTKRSARMREYFQHIWADEEPECLDHAAYWRVARQAQAIDEDRYRDSVIGGCNWWPLPNVWLGVSVEDQTRADERVPDLLATPAAVRFVSCEPLLGPVDLTKVCMGESDIVAVPGGGLEGCTRMRFNINALAGVHSFSWRGLDWVIVGGESGRDARKMQPAWARLLRDQCAAAGVPFLFKQWGAWAPLWPACKPDTLYLTTKANAGRLLDGFQHDGMPA